MHRRDWLWASRPPPRNGSLLQGLIRVLYFSIAQGICVCIFKCCIHTDTRRKSPGFAPSYTACCCCNASLEKDLLVPFSTNLFCLSSEAFTILCNLQVKVALYASQIQQLDGAMECAEAHVASSLAPQNARVSAWMEHPEQAAQHELWPLLIDPQTSTSSRSLRS